MPRLLLGDHLYGPVEGEDQHEEQGKRDDKQHQLYNDGNRLSGNIHNQSSQEGVPRLLLGDHLHKPVENDNDHHRVQGKKEDDPHQLAVEVAIEAEVVTRLVQQLSAGVIGTSRVAGKIARRSDEMIQQSPVDGPVPKQASPLSSEDIEQCLPSTSAGVAGDRVHHVKAEPSRQPGSYEKDTQVEI